MGIHSLTRSSSTRISASKESMIFSVPALEMGWLYLAPSIRDSAKVT